MNKPRIFINMHYMELGGAERALLGMLYAIDTTKVDVDLFLNQHTGAFMPLIPSKINLIPEESSYSAIERPLLQVLREGHFRIVLARLIARLKYRFYLKKNRLENDGTATHFVFEEVIHFLPSLKKYGRYDLAISYLDPPHIVQDKVWADKKVEWIHTDFGGELFHYDKVLTHKRWSANDHIMSISDAITESFAKVFPDLRSKIVKMENIIPKALIWEQSQMFEVSEYHGKETIFKLCSVGRLSYQKNFECIPVVARLLKQKNLSFHWWVIGPGDLTLYNTKLHEEGVNDVVSFIGPRDNPYPYMKHCDVYVQPSRWEGKAVTVQEAQMLAKPVIITRYPTSSSQIEDGKDGIICEMDNESIADAIIKLSSDKSEMEALGKRAAEMHCGNDEEILKLYHLLGI